MKSLLIALSLLSISVSSASATVLNTQLGTETTPVETIKLNFDFGDTAPKVLLASISGAYRMDGAFKDLSGGLASETSKWTGLELYYFQNYSGEIRGFVLTAGNEAELEYRYGDLISEYGLFSMPDEDYGNPMPEDHAYTAYYDSIKEYQKQFEVEPQECENQDVVFSGYDPCSYEETLKAYREEQAMRNAYRE